MTPRSDTTLADHLRVIRRSAPLIILVGVICAAAGLGLSLIQHKTYSATASVAVSDPSTELALVGSAGYTIDTALQLASIHAPTVTRSTVIDAVQASLHGALSPEAIKAAVSIGIDPNSFAVTIEATDASPTLAAEIANDVATVDASLTNATSRQGYAAQAAALAKQLGGSKASTNPATAAIYQDKLQTLQSLAITAQPITIAQTATVPTSPSSPRPARNTVAALIFGLLAGIAIAYLRRALDRRFRTAADAEAKIDLPVVGRIRRDALGHAGADRAKHSDFAPIDAEAFRILRHNVQFLAAGSGLNTLLVTSSIAEEGKSTVAACIALSYAETGQRTLLIECDLRRPVMAGRFGLAGRPGLTDYLTGQASPQQVLQVVEATSPAPRDGLDRPAGQLVCITAGTPAPNPSGLLASDRFHELLDEAGQAYDIVVLDSAPLLSIADTLEIVPHVSAVLMCLRIGQTTHEQARAAVDALTRLPSRPTGLVLTNLQQTQEEYYGYYAETVTSVPA